MNVSPVSVAVIDKKTITKAEVMRAGKDGKSAKIQAITNGKYLLTQGNDGVAPENITVKRVGKNLLVMLEGSDSNNPDLIIEDFFAKSGSLVGKAEDGEMHEYVATDGHADHEAAALVDGETAALALSEGTVDTDSGYALASGFEWSPALIALGGLAAIAAAAGLGYVAAKEQYQDSNNSGKSGKGGDGGKGGDDGKGGGDNGGGNVSVPVVNGIFDDVGSITGLIAKGSRTDDTTPTLNGTGTKGNVIEVWDGTIKIGETTVGENGTWSFTPGKALGAGSHSITTRERNEKGVVGESSEAWGFVIDLTAPAKGTIGGMFDDSTNPPKEITKDGVTKDSTPSLSGKAEAGSTVEIWKNGQLQGTAKTDSEGNWKFTCPKLADGKHDFSIVVVDQVGNKSLPSDAWIVEIDTIAPENKGIGAIKDSNEKPIENSDETEDSTPTFSGVGEKGDIVKIIDNGKVIGSTVIDDKGEWTFTPEKALENGKHEFQIIVVDPAGNQSQLSEKVVVDINDPNAPIDPVPGDEVIPDPNVPVTGVIGDVYRDEKLEGGQKFHIGKTPIASGEAVNDSTIFVGGTGVAGDIVYIWINGADNHFYLSSTVDAKGKWSIATPDLPDDKYSIEAAFKDAEGVVTSKTPAFEVKIDTIPPGAVDPGDLFPDSIGHINIADLLSDQQDTLFGEPQEGNVLSQHLDESALNNIMSDFNVNHSTLNGVVSLDVSSVDNHLEFRDLSE
ncbi:Ig-like domain-containing protein [Pantoea trifolii]|uniref:Ig-like domain-containing protein n=1 Tax=Pantoea trifolii TaxID=2968030 RepID=A0ABT1VR60_9GAMM|nr:MULTISPECIES: Ig-like domain-containing protein [unclassified Pantoea]MCQ8229054.1 Ig-like domain-containing protein [Pantoea sp. MMK2]MCQ8237228.1 Ig-like domain-containing protein [Pantoea sp. MMK3]